MSNESVKQDYGWVPIATHSGVINRGTALRDEPLSRYVGYKHRDGSWRSRDETVTNPIEWYRFPSAWRDDSPMGVEQ